MAQRQQAANLQKETPEYQQALFNLMQAKEQNLLWNAFRQAAPNMTPEELAKGLLMFKQDPSMYNRVLQGQQWEGRQEHELGLQQDKQKFQEEVEFPHKIKLKGTPSRHISGDGTAGGAGGAGVPIEQRQALMEELKEVNHMLATIDDPTELDLLAQRRNSILQLFGFSEEEIASLSREGQGKLKVMQSVSKLMNVPVKDLVKSWGKVPLKPAPGDSTDFWPE